MWHVTLAMKTQTPLPGPRCPLLRFNTLLLLLQRLFDYIGGKNEPNVKINMTAPVVTKVEHGDGPFCKSNFTVSFFVPFADQVSFRLAALDLLLLDLHGALMACAKTWRQMPMITLRPASCFTCLLSVGVRHKPRSTRAICLCASRAG